jgi:hypothetical protein
LRVPTEGNNTGLLALVVIPLPLLYSLGSSYGRNKTEGGWAAEKIKTTGEKTKNQKPPTNPK